jgi:isoquinoline 1-oxidoreductase beta subunit
LIGTNVGQKDDPDYVSGSAVFGSDVTLPGMLYAVVARPPHRSSRVESYDDTQTLAIPGVRHVVPFDNKVAVVAENTWQALKGRGALAVNWRDNKNADSFSAPSDQDGVQRSGNTLSASYTIPHFAHVTMEPMTCVADVQENTTVVWAPTQSPLEAKNTTVSVLGGVFSGDQVEVQIPLIGGGFGRRIAVDYVQEAVQISKAINTPVKVFWTRADDIRYDYLHPCGTIKVEAPLDSPRMPRLRRTDHDSPAQTGAWRAVGQNDIAFARESFINEYAEALGVDPIELRRQIYPEEPLVRVMDKALTEFGWGAPLSSGRAHGIACFSTWGVTHVAQIAEVSVGADGKIRVHRVVCAVDCGIVINPDIVREQMEGGIAFALSAALGREITIKDGQIEQSNFHDYPILRIDEMPEVDVHILSSDRDPQGVGEMSGPPVIPAVANAVYALTGKRLRRLPFRF